MTYPVDYSHTADARVRRVEKAMRLADALDDLGFIPNAGQRRDILRDLGMKAASDETWSMAVEIYMERHPEDSRR